MVELVGIHSYRPKAELALTVIWCCSPICV